MNLNNEKLVDSAFIVAPESSNRKNMHVLRNSYISILEGKIFIYVYPCVAAHRGYMELDHGKEDFQYWDPEVKKAIVEWKSIIETDLREGEYSLQINFFESQAKNIRFNDLSKGQKAEDFKKQLARFVELYTDSERDTLNTAQSSFWSVMRSNYKIEYINQWMENMWNSIMGATSCFEFKARFDNIV